MKRGILGAVLAVIVCAAIPYGTVEPWWKAAFACAVFAICIVAIVESFISGSYHVPGGSILLPMLALSALAFLQTLSLDPHAWTTISADPFQTRFFALQMLALTVFLALLYRYAATERRIRILVYTILGVAAASAVFGILRQTAQHETGFILPLLKQNQGYAQFINKNHFAYLMEMAFGLGLGIILGGGVTRDRVTMHFALLLPIWTALVLSNSRGGVLALLVQILIAALMLLSFRSDMARSIALRAVLMVALVAGLLFGTLWVGGDRLVTNFEAAASELNGERTKEGATRNEIWRASLKMFVAHPILGVGLGGYWIGITAYHNASGLMTPQEAHNDYLELLSSGGLIGLAIGIWFAVMVIRAARKNLFVDNGFMGAVKFGAVLGIAGAAAHSLMDFGLHMIANAVVFITLIMMATTSKPEMQTDKIVDLSNKRTVNSR